MRGGLGDEYDCRAWEARDIKSWPFTCKDYAGAAKRISANSLSANNNGWTGFWNGIDLIHALRDTIKASL